ncbi:integrase [Mesorhizobium argentiipisi]|uniref:Integrase n=1 Tax=Mesorhizobium argentiipisi TaxID=3015175 RepID=A0ABU8KJL3_9HYPH
MGKVLKETEITTAKARGRLPRGEHGRRLDAEAHLYYRKGASGGAWFVRWRNRGTGANYRQVPLGPANDQNDKATDGLLTFHQAESAARERVADARAETKAAADGAPIVVRAAVADYIADRDKRDSKRKGREVRSDAAWRLGRHVLTAPLADVQLHKLEDADLSGWREGLPAALKATTRQRLVNDLKAALNDAYAKNRKRLPGTLPAVIKHGLKAAKIEDEAAPVARENQILSDDKIARLLTAARAVDADEEWEGDLFRLVLVLAATGARFSQVVRLTVADYQKAEKRLLVPVSRKGRGGKSGALPVPVGDDVLAALLPSVEGREPNEPLLARWRHVQVAGDVRWQRSARGPWQSASELVRPWRAIQAKAELPGVIPYSMRHSSIVRGIGANLPIRLVAALHDTSVAMIERHYGRWIADGLEELATRAVVPLVPSGGGTPLA